MSPDTIRAELDAILATRDEFWRGIHAMPASIISRAERVQLGEAIAERDRAHGQERIQRGERSRRPHRKGVVVRNF